MPTCSFCKKIFESPRGLSIFLNDGKILFFCSSKCQKNRRLGRDPRKTEWVKRKKKKGEKISKEEKITQIKEEVSEEKTPKSA
jgi:large subunit ribosomal protein L24e